MSARDSCLAAIFLLLLVFALPLRAEEARPVAEDPVAEKRLLSIAEELRCLVCQNETIAASNAELAKDLRREIRAMISAGKSDPEIIDFMVTRYGDFVLYRPPFKASTWLLWLLPPFFLLLGIAGVRIYLTRRSRRLSDAAPLSEETLLRAKRLLADESPAEPDASAQSAPPVSR
ncbi:MAG: cytochrome c-type biogenesis protein CcmH [Zoogloeaceae bacterium]|jgi:cytochrome c-type biogenesis protein CcmH|nr:cytochrome c-type biogenesis protein CcmH [Zoogloeaceae bacterium]